MWDPVAVDQVALTGIRAGVRQLQNYGGGYLFTYDKEGVIQMFAQVGL